jgi:taurine dioxygenase
VSSQPEQVALLSVTPIRKGVGVEVHGLELDPVPSFAVIQALRAALLEHGLLLFRGRTLEPEQQIALTVALGGGIHRCSPPTQFLCVYPEIFRVSNKAGEGNLNNGNYWHSDGAYLPDPTAVTLHHIIFPTRDGDTLYADLRSAYDRLGPRERALLGKMKTRSQVPTVAYPLIWEHPLTGRAILYPNLDQGAAIVDEAGAPQPPLSAYLREHLNRGCYRHKWRAGDLIVVDNFAVAHCATPAHPSALRVLHRTTVPGPRVWWRTSSPSKPLADVLS